MLHRSKFDVVGSSCGLQHGDFSLDDTIILFPNIPLPQSWEWRVFQMKAIGHSINPFKKIDDPRTNSSPLMPTSWPHGSALFSAPNSRSTYGTEDYLETTPKNRRRLTVNSDTLFLTGPDTTAKLGEALITKLEGMCAHSSRWTPVERFLRGVFRRDELSKLPISDFAIFQARSDALDALQAAFGNDPGWPLIRSRVLDTFGKSGMQRLIKA
jgi:hypothetical protein